MRNSFLLAICLIASTFATAQSDKDVEAIKSMCGCYEVTFQFAETFASDTAYEFHDNYKASALEWVELIDDKAGHVEMQHLLIVGEGNIVKHWRQDWIFEPTSTMKYVSGRHWSFAEVDPSTTKGAWEQRVYQVDDSPRYGAVGTWVHVDGRSFWETEARAPLPRREYTKRSDYNVMDRRNRHEIIEGGWIHEQDNKKVILTEEGEEVLAEEKGMNTYVKVDDKKCKAAKKYWMKNDKFWEDVRKVWNDHYPVSGELNLHSTIDEKPLYMFLFSVPEEGLDEIIGNFIIK